MRFLKTNHPDTHPSVTNDPSQYVTKEIAAELLNLSPRRVLELADEGKIRRHETYNPATKRRQTVLSAEDVKRLAGERTGTAVVPIAASSPQLAASSHLASRAEAPPVFDLDALWLSLDAAEVYSGLPADHLAGAIEAGELPARDVGIRRGVRGRWRVRRQDLDNLQGATRGARKKNT
jgi:hypothetical protein